MSNDIPRRARADLYVPAETAIREAMLAVEAMGADVRLTDAVVLLGKAKDAVADYVDDDIENLSDGDYDIRVFWKDHEYGGGAWYWEWTAESRAIGPFDSPLDAGKAARQAILDRACSQDLWDGP